MSRIFFRQTDSESVSGRSFIACRRFWHAVADDAVHVTFDVGRGGRRVVGRRKPADSDRLDTVRRRNVVHVSVVLVRRDFRSDGGRRVAAGQEGTVDVEESTFRDQHFSIISLFINCFQAVSKEENYTSLNMSLVMSATVKDGLYV